jgi:hypothetical protein
LCCASPELSWDEADYMTSTARSWFDLWSDHRYIRHTHGPLALYLAKAGHRVNERHQGPSKELVPGSPLRLVQLLDGRRNMGAG